MHFLRWWRTCFILYTCMIIKVIIIHSKIYPRVPFSLHVMRKMNEKKKWKKSTKFPYKPPVDIIKCTYKLKVLHESKSYREENFLAYGAFCFHPELPYASVAYRSHRFSNGCFSVGNSSLLCNYMVDWMRFWLYVCVF